MKSAETGSLLRSARNMTVVTTHHTREPIPKPSGDCYLELENVHHGVIENAVSGVYRKPSGSIMLGPAHHRLVSV